MGLQYRTGQSRSQFQSMVTPTTPPCSRDRSHEVVQLGPTSLDLACMEKLLFSSYVAFLDATRCPGFPGYMDPTAVSALLGSLGRLHTYTSPYAEALASALNAGYTAKFMPSCSWSASHAQGMVLRNSAHCRSPTVPVGQPFLARFYP